MMVDVKSAVIAERAFKHFYTKLTQALPIKDLVAHFYANNLLPGNHKAKMETLGTPKEKTEYFLDEVIKPGLNIGYTGQFSKMVNIMESSDDPVVNFLATEIKHYILGVSSESDHHNDTGYQFTEDSSGMTNYEQLRKELNVLKTDVTQLRTDNDAMKNENQKLTTLLDKMAVHNQNQIQQSYSLSNEYATMKDEIELLQVENDMLKAENIQLKQKLIQKESTSHGDLVSGLMNIKWKEGTPAPVGCVDHTAALLNGLVYVGGGYDNGTNKIDCYDPVKNSWSSPINTPYRRFAITTLNNKLLTVGGVDENYKATNHILTMDADQLQNYTNMITARSWATAVGYQGMLIITGGVCTDNSILSSTECFDSENGQWYMCDDLPQPSYCLRSVIVDNILYLLGGGTLYGDSPAVFTSPLDTLSRHQLKWKIYQNSPCYAPAFVSIDGTYLLIVGGVKWKEIHKSTRTLDVHKLNKVNHSWEAIGHIPSARKSPAAVCTADNRIIIIGGLNDKGEYTNTVWIGSFEPQ